MVEVVSQEEEEEGEEVGGLEEEGWVWVEGRFPNR